MHLSPPILFIIGPTAVGKTALAIQLASDFGGEIVSADAMQVYRFLDIGTAKPSLEEQALIRHHLIDILDPSEKIDAARFVELALGAIQEIRENGKLPFVVGGSGFYLRALRFGLFNLFDAPAKEPADPLSQEKIREELEQELNTKGIQSLYQRLCDIDPKRAAKIHPNDAYRIMRALEIYALCGAPPSTLYETHRSQAPSTSPILGRRFLIGLDRERKELYRRIDARVDEMVAQGWVEEVQKLLGAAYSPELPAMQGLGYRHIVEFLQGKISLEDAIQQIKRDTRRFAKRQLTWFRNDPEISWFHPEDQERIEQVIRDFLEKAEEQR